MQYLSEEWIEAAAAALDAAPAGELDVSDATSSIQYEVTAAPGGKVRYAIVVEGGRVRLVPGPFKDASVTFTLDYPTASAIAQGELSAQAAFMQGKLKLGGNVTTLIEQHGLLAATDDALSELRAATTY